MFYSHTTEEEARAYQHALISWEVYCLYAGDDESEEGEVWLFMESLWHGEVCVVTDWQTVCKGRSNK